MVKPTTCRVVVTRPCYVAGSLRDVGDVVSLSTEDALNATQSTRCKFYSDEDRLMVHVAVEQQAKVFNKSSGVTPHVRNPDSFVRRY